MGSGAARAARMPRDARARDRLRDAQQEEATALAGVCVAQDALRRACAKREAVLAAATEAVDQAQASVAAAQAALVRISGTERAALLLGTDPGQLRKVAGSKTRRKADR